MLSGGGRKVLVSSLRCFWTICLLAGQSCYDIVLCIVSCRAKGRSLAKIHMKLLSAVVMVNCRCGAVAFQGRLPTAIATKVNFNYPRKCDKMAQLEIVCHCFSDALNNQPAVLLQISFISSPRILLIIMSYFISDEARQRITVPLMCVMRIAAAAATPAKHRKIARARH